MLQYQQVIKIKFYVSCQEFEIYKAIFDNYFDKNSQIHLIGLQCGVIGLVIAWLGNHFAINMLNIIIVLIGLMTTTMMLTQNYSEHNSLQRLHFGLVFSFVCPIAFCVANLVAESVIYSSVCLLILVPLTEFLNGTRLLQSFVFYLVYAFILGLGFQAEPEQLMPHGIAFFSGGVLIVLGGYLRLILRRKYFKRFETIPFVNYSKLLIHPRLDIGFVVILTFTIVISNILAFYLTISHRYWLPMTVLLLFKNDHGLMLKRSIHRIIGSGLGLLCSALLLVVITKAGLIIVMLPLFYLMVITINRHYGVFCVVITLLVMAIIQLMGQSNSQLLIERLLLTIAAISLVIISALVLKCFSSKPKS